MTDLEKRIRRLYMYYLKEAITDKDLLTKYILDDVGKSDDAKALIQKVFNQDEEELPEKIRQCLLNSARELNDQGYFSLDSFVSMLNDYLLINEEFSILKAYEYLEGLKYNPDSDLYKDNNVLQEGNSKTLTIGDKLSKIIDKAAKENDYWYYDKDEWKELSFKEKFDEWNSHNYIEEYFDDLGIVTYNNYLELSSTPVLNFFNNESIAKLGDEEALDFYMTATRDALNSFERDMQQANLLEGEVWQDGRSGKHKVIENNVTNILNYAKLKEEYNKREDAFIEYINNYEGEE